MLRAFHVQNFVLIDDLTLNFGTGFHTFTGETGAGKSLIVDAVSMLMGARAQKEWVRPGAKEAVVEATFDLTNAGQARSLAESLSLAIEDDEINVRRVVTAEGRSKVILGGRLSSTTELAALCGRLIALCGQNAQLEIAEPDQALLTLDRFGRLLELRQKYTAAYEAYASHSQELTELNASEGQRLQRLDYLNFQISELNEAKPVAGEEAELKNARNRLAYAEKIRQGLDQVCAALAGDEGGALSLVGNARRVLRDLVKLDSGLSEPLGRLETQMSELDDLARDFSKSLGGLHSEPGELDRLETRLALLARLAKKHGVAADELAVRLESITAEQVRLSASDERKASLEAAQAQAAKLLVTLGEELSAARRKAARALGAKVQSTLRPLAMPEAKFEVALTTETELSKATSTGLDHAELLISANPGQPLRAVAKVASGGELSRVALAIQSVLGDHSEAPTYVFDEVDAGIGGAVAEVVGQTLATLGERRQVLAVTHLAQIAAMAERQFRVEKVINRGSTTSSVAELHGEHRKEELARMIGGVEITEAVRRHAAELLRRPRTTHVSTFSDARAEKQ